ncbi:sulfatase-like hydrolase/transferase, partial [Streptomyces caeruleatus]
DVEYRTGSNQLYNQFYNYDQQLGKFIDWLSVSPAAKDTVIVLTADHATYPSPAYKKSFRTDIDLFVDRIPLIIYGEGVKSQKLDARNGN